MGASQRWLGNGRRQCRTGGASGGLGRGRCDLHRLKRSGPHLRHASFHIVDRQCTKGVISVFRGHCRPGRGEVARDAQTHSEMGWLCGSRPSSRMSTRDFGGIKSQFHDSVAIASVHIYTWNHPALTECRYSTLRLATIFRDFRKSEFRFLSHLPSILLFFFRLSLHPFCYICHESAALDVQMLIHTPSFF